MWSKSRYALPGPHPTPFGWHILFLLLVGIEMRVAHAEPASAVGPMKRLFLSGRLAPERMEPVVELICKRGNADDLQLIWDRTRSPDKFSPELRLKALSWLADAATTRKVKPVGDLTGIRELAGGGNCISVHISAIRLAAAWNEPAILPLLSELASRTDADRGLQDAAIDGLVAIADEQRVSKLQGLAGPTYPLRIRMRAVAGLAGLDTAAAAPQAATVLSMLTADEPGPLLDAFFQRQGGSDLLASALEHQPLTTDIAKRALRYMYSVGRSDARLSEILSKKAGIDIDTPLPTPEEVAQIVADVMDRGDAARGEQIFRRQDLNCLKCHSLQGAGGQVGPDLSAVGGASPVDYIVNSILNPNLAVKEQYATRGFALTDGKSLMGIVVDRDDVRVQIRDANSQTITVPVADIDEETPGQSLMPQGLTKFLTRPELLDLARFVTELGRPGPYAVRPEKYVRRWRILRDPPQAWMDDVPHLEHIRQLVLGSDMTWESAYATVAGTLPLAEYRAPDTRVLILQGELQAHTAGRIRAQITCNEDWQAWIDTEPVGSDAPFEHSLTTGRHKLTLRVVLGRSEQPELKVEFTTPADSSLHFQVVGGS